MSATRLVLLKRAERRRERERERERERGRGRDLWILRRVEGALFRCNFFPESLTREWTGIGQSEVRRLMFRSDGQARAFNPHLAFHAERITRTNCDESIVKQFLDSFTLVASLARFLSFRDRRDEREKFHSPKTDFDCQSGLAVPKKTVTILTAVYRSSQYTIKETFVRSLDVPTPEILTSSKIWTSEYPFHDSLYR